MYDQYHSTDEETRTDDEQARAEGERAAARERAREKALQQMYDAARKDGLLAEMVLLQPATATRDEEYALLLYRDNRLAATYRAKDHVCIVQPDNQRVT